MYISCNANRMKKYTDKEMHFTSQETGEKDIGRSRIHGGWVKMKQLHRHILS